MHATRIRQPAQWDPKAPDVLSDQIAAYDAMRRRCPVAHSPDLQWSIFRHADVVRVLQQPHAFSNQVSAHLSVPNGMDPPMHTAYRRMIDAYFTPERIAAFEPLCRTAAARLAAKLSADRPVEVVGAIAEPFAVEAQSAFLGWPAYLQEPLLQWTLRNHAATLAQDRAAMAAVAGEFDGYIRDILATCRRAATADDVTSRLLQERVAGRPLTDEEIVSILRNWTVGELATISACVGILVYYIAGHAHVQEQLRQSPDHLPAAIDEILRIHPPLIASRRKATRDASIGDTCVAAGERLTLMWASANRDESVFGDPDEFRLDRTPDDNLLYGAGIHVCPGAPLARLELRVVLEELLRRTKRIVPCTDSPPVRAVYPASGYAQAWVVLTA